MSALDVFFRIADLPPLGAAEDDDIVANMRILVIEDDREAAEYLEKVMLRITYVGAAFLSLVAVIPSLVQNGLNVDFTVAQFLGGTGLLIVVSVCLDLVQKIDSHLVMRNYSGLVDRNRK